MAAIGSFKNFFGYFYDYISGQNWKLTLFMVFCKGNKTIKVKSSVKYHTYGKVGQSETVG